MKYPLRKINLCVVAPICCGPHLRNSKLQLQKIRMFSSDLFYKESSSSRHFILKTNFSSLCIAKLMLYCLLVVGLAGCVSTTYVPYQQYMLEMPSVELNKAKCKKDRYIILDQVEVLAPFDRQDFLYRVSNDRYLLDYYHGFFVSPAEQVNQILEAYLNKHASFGVAVGVVKPHNNLQVKLVELYADYRDRNNPQGVITLRFMLSTSADNKNTLVWDQIFTQRITLATKSTNSLLKAWNTGLNNILKRSVKILNRKVGC